MALAGDQHNVPLARFPDRGGDGLAPVADLARLRPGACEDRGTDACGVLGARVVVGDDREVGGARGDGAHLGALARVAITACAEHDDQPAAVCHMGAKRGDGRFECVGGVGVVDIGGRTGLVERGAFQPPAHRLEPRQGIEGRGGGHPGRDRQAGRDEGIGRLIRTDQGQVDFPGLPFMFDVKKLPQLPGFARDQLEEAPPSPTVRTLSPRASARAIAWAVHSDPSPASWITAGLPGATTSVKRRILAAK